jgi:hypothetical protein
VELTVYVSKVITVEETVNDDIAVCHPPTTDTEPVLALNKINGCKY